MKDKIETLFRVLFKVKKNYSFRAGIYLDEKTKKPQKNEITSLLKWYDKEIIEAYSYKRAINQFREFLENKYPELKGYFWIF